MKILLTNDDGISAAGLLALKDALEGLGEVTVVAPATEQSGVSHSLTYLGPIEAAPARLSDGSPAYRVDGTPADCVKFALLELLDEPADLVVGGLNMGLNTGVNIFYSGTVAAALEGALNGLLGVAVSTTPGDGPHVRRAARQARRVLDNLLEIRQPAARIFNVNIPGPRRTEPEMVFTRQAMAPFKERYRSSGDVAGKRSYRLEAGPRPFGAVEDHTDVKAIREGRISVTPLSTDLTDVEALRRLRGSRSLLA